MKGLEKPRLATPRRGTIPVIKRLSSGNASLIVDLESIHYRKTPTCTNSGSPSSDILCRNFRKQRPWQPPLMTRLQKELRSTKTFWNLLATPRLCKAHL